MNESDRINISSCGTCYNGTIYALSTCGKNFGVMFRCRCELGLKRDEDWLIYSDAHSGMFKPIKF